MSDKKLGFNRDYLNDKKTMFTIVCLTSAFVIVILISFGVSLVLRPINSSEFLSDFNLSISTTAIYQLAKTCCFTIFTSSAILAYVSKS